MTRIVAISDTHNQAHKLNMPDGDILVHAGDATYQGKPRELIEFNLWLGEQTQYKHRIVIAGNHDWLFEKDPTYARSLMTNCTYLQDSGVEIDGLYFYGSPWQPRFYDWAFNADRGEDIWKHWEKIPTSTNVLITHGPPYGILDQTPAFDFVGCKDLLKKVRLLQENDEVDTPRFHAHIFGHIHYKYGIEHDKTFGTYFVNASSCNEEYKPVNQPIVIDI